jgi:hypothetical protein
VQVEAESETPAAYPAGGMQEEDENGMVTTQKLLDPDVAAGGTSEKACVLYR